MLINHVLHPIVSASFLVGYDTQKQVSRRPLIAGSNPENCDAAFHIERASPPDVAVAEDSVKRRVCPLYSPSAGTIST